MIKNNPAIYKLQSKTSDLFYVGGTRNAQSRKRQHEYDLRKTRHRNPKLQQAFLDGERFSFIVLEYLPEDFTDDQIVRREQEWMKFLNPPLNSRNAIPLFGSDIYIAKERKLAGVRTTPQTDEEKKKRSESVKKYWRERGRRTLSQEEKNIISEKVKGKNHPRWGKKTPEERKRRIADSVSSVEWTFVTPNGKEMCFRNLKSFCKKNNLTENSMLKLSSGKIKKGNYKGWTFKGKKFIGYKKDR